MESQCYYFSNRITIFLTNRGLNASCQEKIGVIKFNIFRKRLNCADVMMNWEERKNLLGVLMDCAKYCSDGFMAGI